MDPGQWRVIISPLNSKLESSQCSPPQQQFAHQPCLHLKYDMHVTSLTDLAFERCTARACRGDLHVQEFKCDGIMLTKACSTIHCVPSSVSSHRAKAQRSRFCSNMSIKENPNG
jgi:hypothetical protein